MAYVLYYDLADWIAGAESGYDERVYVQPTIYTRNASDLLLAAQTSAITMTAEGHDHTIHAAHIVIERIDRMSRDGDKGMAQRYAQALGLVEDYIKAHWKEPTILRGVMLESGMSAELDALRTSHNLWTFEQSDRQDARTRRLIPTSEL